MMLKDLIFRVKFIRKSLTLQPHCEKGSFVSTLQKSEIILKPFLNAT